MCLNRDDVTAIVGDALAPILSLLDDMKKKVEGLVQLALKQTELEGQILNLKENTRNREKFEQELFDRVRAIEAMTEPRSSCAAIFNGFDKSNSAAEKAILALDKQIKDRTWAILLILIGAFVSAGGSITVAAVIYFITRS
jgi:hypothetical protein